MQQLAAAFGTFIGYALGYVLKIAGPELKTFLVSCIREAFNDTAEVGTRGGPLASHWDDGVRREETHSDSNGRDGNQPGQWQGSLPKQ